MLEALGLQRGAIVAVGGAGGKSALVCRLVREAGCARWRTLVTATTRLGLSAASACGAHLQDDPRAGFEPLAAAWSSGGAVALAGPCEADGTSGRWAGLAPERVDEWARSAELTLVESDGARRRWLKLPAPHEPVLPASTTHLVVLARLSILGLPLDAAHVHRCERVADLLARRLGRRPGSILDETALAEVLLAPEGYLARRRPGLRLVVFLNQPDGEPAAAGVAERLAVRLAGPYAAVLAGSSVQGALQVWD